MPHTIDPEIKLIQHIALSRTITLATMSLTPPPVASYLDVNTAFTALQLHAKQHGYALMRFSSKPFRAVFACDRARTYDSRSKDREVDPSKRRTATGSKKCGCGMRVALRLDKVESLWMVEVLHGEHNHGPSVAATAHPAHRSATLVPSIRAQISTLSQAGFLPSQILHALQVTNPGINLIAKDISNIQQALRAEQLDGKTPIQWLLNVRIHYPYCILLS
jgi:hypothetical protein